MLIYIWYHIERIRLLTRKKKNILDASVEYDLNSSGTPAQEFNILNRRKPTRLQALQQSNGIAD